MVLLHGCSNHKISLGNALTACAEILTEAVALLYSPQSCQFARVEPDGNLSDYKGQIIDLQYVFEARVFNLSYELRWLNRQNGLGQAVLISEQEVSTYLKDIIEPLPVLDDTIPQKYILWGKGMQELANVSWGVLATARIGSLPVPISGITHGKRVYLNSREYLQEDDYGNVAVVEERLINLEVK